MNLAMLHRWPVVIKQKSVRSHTGCPFHVLRLWHVPIVVERTDVQKPHAEYANAGTGC